MKNERTNEHHYHTLSLIVLWQYLLYIVRGSTREVLDISALTVEVREYYDLLLVVLT